MASLYSVGVMDLISRDVMFKSTWDFLLETICEDDAFAHETVTDAVRNKLVTDIIIFNNDEGFDLTGINRLHDCVNNTVSVLQQNDREFAVKSDQFKYAINGTKIALMHLYVSKYAR